MRRLGPTGLCGVLAALGGCASGPHPALALAHKDFNCAQAELTLHEIYPHKVRVEGCGREAIYVKACSGYGTDSSCGWAKWAPTR